MMLLNTSMLALLGVLAVPLLLHLIQPRRRREQPISTVRFLQEIQSSRVRVIRWRRWLLLAVRSLLLALLVFVFARPMLQADLPAAALREPVYHLILLDNSFSATLPADGEQAGVRVWDRIRKELQILLDQADEEDRFVIQTLSRPLSSAHSPMDAGQTSSLLEELEASSAAADLEGGLQRAAELVSAWPAHLRELHLFSDAAFELDLDSLNTSLPEDLRAFLHISSAASVNDRAVKELQLRTRLLRRGDPVEIEVQMAGEACEGELVMQIEGETLASAGLQEEQLPPLRFRLPAAGELQGELRTNGTDVPEDDLLRFSLLASEELRVSLATADAELSTLLRAALVPREEYEREFLLESLQLNELDRFGGDTEVLVLGLGGSLPAAAPSLIARAVAEGMGLMLVLESMPDLREANHLLAALQLPGALALERGPWRTEYVDLEHALYDGVMRRGEKPAPAMIHQRLQLASQAEMRTLVEAGGPLLLETRHGRGRILLLLASPLPEGSELAAAGLFAPTLSRGVRYLAAGANALRYWFCGEAGELEWRETGVSRLLLRGPAGEFLLRVPQEGAPLQLPPMATPGWYTLFADAEELARIPVNAAGEDLFRPVMPVERLEAVSHLSWRQGHNTKKLLLESRGGKEVWWPLLLLAIALLALESWLATGGRA